MHSKSSEVRAYLGLILTFIIWGSLYVVSNILLKSLPTFFIAFMRYAIAFITMSVMFRVHVSKMKGAKTSKKLHLDRMGRRYVFILGFCGYVISVGLQLLGTKYAGSTMASLINALNLLRSQQIREGRPTDPVNELLMKIIDSGPRQAMVAEKGASYEYSR